MNPSQMFQPVDIIKCLNYSGWKVGIGYHRVTASRMAPNGDTLIAQIDNHGNVDDTIRRLYIKVQYLSQFFV